jgi:hypothetical protein
VTFKHTARGISSNPTAQIFTLIDTLSMTVTLFEAVRPPIALVIGGSEGGMKRALACSLDITTGTLYRETVLRIPTQSADRMERMPRLRLGLQRPIFRDWTEVRPGRSFSAPEV